MFGLNDNNTQAKDDNVKDRGAPPLNPANPFGDSPTQPPTEAPSPTAPSMDSRAPSSKPSGISSDAPAVGNDLLDIKQQALQSLQPLVSQLEQSPEERFKTTMMLIQATDNSSLVKDAYEAAKQISDEKARAQALLDVVNEINYFTHSQNGDNKD